MGLPPVLHGAALHQSSDGRGQVRGHIVAVFLRQSRVSRDVEETDRRQALEAAVDARRLHHRLEALDDVGGPGARLMHAIHSDDGLLCERRAPVGELGVGDLVRALARGDGRRDHLGVPPRRLLLGDPAGAVAVDPEQSFDR